MLWGCSRFFYIQLPLVLRPLLGCFVCWEALNLFSTTRYHLPYRSFQVRSLLIPLQIVFFVLFASSSERSRLLESCDEGRYPFHSIRVVREVYNSSGDWRGARDAV